MLVMIHQLEDADELQVTVLNFSDQVLFGSVHSDFLTPGSMVVDMFSDQVFSEVDDLRTFSVALGGHQGLSLLVRPRIDADSDVGVPAFAESLAESLG